MVAVDIQTFRMLERLKRRAAKAGLLNRLDARLASPDSMALADLAGSVDFTLAFAGVDEFPDAREFFRQIGAASKSRASLFAGGAPRPRRIHEVRKPVGCSPPERLRSALAAFGAAQPCSFSARVSESEQLVLL